MQNKFIHYLKLLRPHQWLKNSFVWVGVLFGHGWNNLTLLYQVIALTVAFCGLASSIYILNDIFDIEQDRSHPYKKNRPIPAGAIKISTALTIAGCLALFALMLGFYCSIKAGFILLIYILLNTLYSFALKNIVIVDVFIIAFGFMLRILAGTYGVEISPSNWLLLCSMLLTLFLGFAKRRSEFILLTDQSVQSRTVLRYYNLSLLDNLIAICASGAIISYCLYTLSPATIQLHHTTTLIYTIPLVIYGIFRYLYLLYTKKLLDGQDIAKEIIYDKPLLLVILAWFFLTYFLLS